MAVFAAAFCAGGAHASRTAKAALTGWPDIGGLTVKADNGKLTFYAAGVELATAAPKKSVTLFDLLPARGCESTAELGKLVSLLLVLKGSFPADAPSKGKLADMTEAELMALEKSLVGRSMTVQEALLKANAGLDLETWTESAGERTLFENDMCGALKNYLNRARAALARPVPSLSGFGDISEAEIAKIPGTMKSQGLAFDGAAPVFSWRYGLQRADGDYDATLSRPLAIPPDIQAEHYNPASKNGFSHIGDIDIAGGRLYAPIEDEDNRTKPFIALFDPKTLRYTGEKHLLPVDKLKNGVPWIAVDAKRRVFYTMNWDSQDLLVFDLSTYLLARTVPLTVLNPKIGGSAVAEKTVISRVQGAKVHDGMLYASSDSQDDVLEPKGSKLKRKRIYKIDPVSGGTLEIVHFDEPERSESEGLAFSPDGRLNVLVLAPYFYDSNFGPEYEIGGDDWNPSAKLMRFVRAQESLRERLCRMGR